MRAVRAELVMLLAGPSATLRGKLTEKVRYIRSSYYVLFDIPYSYCDLCIDYTRSINVYV